MSWNWAIWIVVGYLSGSVSFALVLSRLHGVDLRTVGSGNLGATNVGRALGRWWGVLCFLLDVVKGLAPVLAAGFAMGRIAAGGGGADGAGADGSLVEACAWLGVGAAAVVGHMFPFYLGFRGGKGVATSLGVLLAYWPIVTAPAGGAFAVWIVMVLIFRYVSLASMAAAVSLPIWLVLLTWVQGGAVTARLPFLIIALALAVLVVVRHQGNIKRLLAGTESRIGSRASGDGAGQSEGVK